MKFRSRLVLSKRMEGSRKYFFHARLSIAKLAADAVDSILLIAWIKICRTEFNMLSGIKEIDGAAPQRVPILILILIYKLLFEISKLSSYLVSY